LNHAIPISSLFIFPAAVSLGIQTVFKGVATDSNTPATPGPVVLVTTFISLPALRNFVYTAPRTVSLSFEFFNLFYSIPGPLFNNGYAHTPIVCEKSRKNTGTSDYKLSNSNHGRNHDSVRAPELAESWNICVNFKVSRPNTIPIQSSWGPEIIDKRI
jgi:hypothetical protein